MTEKIKTTRIRIERAEGLITQCVAFDITRGHIIAGGDLWANAEMLLRAMSHDAPESSSYNKVDFRIEWEDGEVYTGTYDLTSPAPGTAIERLSEHVVRHCMYASGYAKPSHWTQERQQAILKRQDAADIRKAGAFLTDYETGEWIELQGGLAELRERLQTA